MEFRDYVSTFRTHWLGVLVVTLVTMVAAAVYILARPSVYAADASGFVSAGATQDPALASVYDELAKSRAVSYVDIAATRSTAEEVGAALDLDEDPASLVTRIDVENPVDTVFVKITARANTARAAQALANAWVEALANQVARIEDPEGRNRAGTLRVIPLESAALPTEPISPKPVRDLALGLVLGLLLGAAYAVARNLLDRRLRTPRGVTERFDVNVVGVVPVSDALRRGPDERVPLALSSDDTGGDSAAGEAFRKLRSNLMYRAVDDPPRVIVVTSPKPGDGKSTMAINLAASIAAGGEPVFLVDANLREPSLASSLGLAGVFGLTDVLLGDATVQQALQRYPEAEHVAVIAAGRVPPNPSELLGSMAMGAVLDELGGSATVILDAPPLLPVTDAAVLTARADGALVVISAGRTVDDELGTALAELERVNGRALGVIINKVPRKRLDQGNRNRQPSGRLAADGATAPGDERRSLDGGQDAAPSASAGPAAAGPITSR